MIISLKPTHFSFTIIIIKNARHCCARLQCKIVLKKLVGVFESYFLEFDNDKFGLVRDQFKAYVDVCLQDDQYEAQ